MHIDQKSSAAVAVVGIDIGNNTFHPVIDKRGAIVLPAKVLGDRRNFVFDCVSTVDRLDEFRALGDHEAGTATIPKRFRSSSSKRFWACSSCNAQHTTLWLRTRVSNSFL